MNRKSLAKAIARVHEQAKKYGGSIIPSAEISRADRELLIRTSWLQEIIRGWYMLVRPDVSSGDTSGWYANFFEFIHLYLKELYDADYCLSAENSIDIHIGSPTIPKQVIVVIKKGGSRTVKLPFNTSLFIYDDPNNFPPEITTVRGLQVMTLPYALCKATPTYFQKNGTDVQIALGLIKDIQELIYIIANYHFTRAGDRIVGAFEALQDVTKAETIRNSLKKIGIGVKSINPFEQSLPLENGSFRSPYQGRIITLWRLMRLTIIDHFPPFPGIRSHKQEYLISLEDLYLKDAYNSLSIEGYHVTPELIERVLNNDWNPDLNPLDGQAKDALAARGYYEAFLEVKKSIAQILNGAQPGEIIRKELFTWFQKLFSPNIQAGILKAAELLGYRRHQVYIRNSRHVPLPKEALIDAMDTFFNCLEQEPHPAVRAILGHFMFVYIHPFMDGNGRLGRFIMNTMFASGGYPWTIIQMKNRSRYFAALETASVEQNILPFVLFVKDEMYADFS